MRMDMSFILTILYLIELPMGGEEKMINFE